jgi:hypothetical protein
MTHEVKGALKSDTMGVSDDSGWTIGTSPTPTAVASDTGGTVAAGTYYFKISTTFRGGNAPAGAESTAATVTTSTGSIAISWTPVAGASFYNIYRTTVSGTYTTPTLIATTSGSSFTWTDGVATGGIPNPTAIQIFSGGRAAVNDIFTTSGVQYSSATINSVSGLTANDTNITNGLAVRKTVQASSTYNHGVNRGIFVNNSFFGSGSCGNMQSGNFQLSYGGSGSSIGSLVSVVGTTSFNGTTTGTTSIVSGVQGIANVLSAGRATNIYGGQFSGQLFSSGSQNPTAGTIYGVRAEASHASTGKTVDAMYGTYGLANATSNGGAATRIQGGFFQASVGNGTGGAAVTAPTHRGVEGWAYVNSTGVVGYSYGGLFTATIDGTVSTEVQAISGVVYNQSTVATVPLIYGTRISVVNQQTATSVYGGITETLHDGATAMSFAAGFSTNVQVRNAAGSVGTAKGLESSVLITSGGVINDGYGLYIGAVQATNAWGIWQSTDSIKNYFASKTLIGRTSDDGSVLQVEGALSSTSLRVQAYGDGSIYPTLSRDSDGGLIIDSYDGGGLYGGHIIKVGAAETARFAGTGDLLVGTTVNDEGARVKAYRNDGSTTAPILSAEADVGSFTGASVEARNTLGASGTYDLFRGVVDSDADAGGPFTVFRVSGDGVIHTTGVRLATATKTANYTVLSTDYTIRADATGGAVTITLPDAGGVAGQVFCVKKVDPTSNTVNIATTSAQTIDDETGVAVYLKGTSITVQSNGTNWDIL